MCWTRIESVAPDVHALSGSHQRWDAVYLRDAATLARCFLGCVGIRF